MVTYLSDVSCMTSEDLTKSMQVSRRRGREEQEGRLSVRSTALNELRAMLPPVPSEDRARRYLSRYAIGDWCSDFCVTLVRE